MATYKGRNYNLVFMCDECNYNESNGIEVNPESMDDMKKLGNWLLQHSARGGRYKNILVREECTLCGEIYDKNRIVTYTGRPVCKVCAKSIAQQYVVEN